MVGDRDTDLYFDDLSAILKNKIMLERFHIANSTARGGVTGKKVTGSAPRTLVQRRQKPETEKREGYRVCVLSYFGMLLQREVKVMKVRASVKRRCEFCQIIKRNGTIRVICSRDARHKQRQG